jgi:cation diffusion facilitator CzcD-associated flavoprotein CzcO
VRARLPAVDAGAELDGGALIARRSNDREFPVVVIGAGSAGLCTGAALGRRGIPVVVLERGARVGTSWRQRHEELRLNTDRWLSSLPGLRLPREAGRWAGRDDFVAHLEAFTARHALDVRCGVTVDRIDRSGVGWRLTTDDGEVDASDVVIATGHDRVPHIPDWPGRDDFALPLQHVAGIRRVADLAGRRVLLVGAGNSGIEMAGQLVEAGVRELWLSARTPPTILPLQLAGLPMDLIGVAARPLPEGIRDAVAGAISRLIIGDLAPCGLPAPVMGPYRTLRTTGVTGAVDRGFARHLRAGRLEVVGLVDRLWGEEVVLRDGSVLRPDVVVLATGFRTGLEPLVGHLGVLDGRGSPRSGPGRALPGCRGLWFVGFWPALEGALRQHPIEARRIARAIDR